MAKSREVKHCNGFKGCNEPIYTGTEYKKLRGNKQLYSGCYNKLTKLSDCDTLTLLTNEHINGE